jgi:hypothetical protein
METAEVIAENDVTKAGLAEIFKRAFLRTSFDNDGDLIVDIDGARIIITLDQANKLIRFMYIYPTKKSVDVNAKQIVINRLNNELMFTRFAIPQERPDLLVADYYISYEEGIPAFQLVSAVRLLRRVILGAMRICDQNGILD